MAYKYETRIDNEDGLQAVLIAIRHFNYDRFTCVLYQKSRFDLTHVLSLDAEVLAVTAKLEIEYAKLVTISRTFNQRFVLPNNQVFSAAKQLLNSIRSGLSELKKLYKFFTPNKAAPVPTRPIGNSIPYIYNRSQLGNAEYMQSLFPDEIEPKAKQLFNHLFEFLKLIEQAFILCEDVLHEENEIRKDSKQCHELYIEFKNDQYQSIFSLIKTDCFNKNILGISNSATELRENSPSEEVFSQKGFHNLPHNDVIGLATKELFEKAQYGDCTPDELALFKEDEAKIKRVRSIIQNFDSILENLTKKNNIPAEAIASLLVWSKPIEKLKFYNYVKKTYKEAGGKRELTSYFGMCSSSYDIERKKKYLEYIEKFERFN
ncbi:MAG: hypothetical protein MST03_04655 [Bacteroidales bacterium]|nr:hypothetical protein [Bacteroidales bacterium]